MTSKTSMTSLGSPMKRSVIGAAMLALMLTAGAANAKPKPAKPKTDKTPIKLYLSPASTVPSADIVKNLMYKCPNVTVTLNSKESDYMLEARGWPEHYRFTLFRKGGDAAFATSTVLLSNAVKDVCRYVNTYPPPAHSETPAKSAPAPKPFKPSKSGN
jgi:hypothetical protein